VIETVGGRALNHLLEESESTPPKNGARNETSTITLAFLPGLSSPALWHSKTPTGLQPCQHLAVYDERRRARDSHPLAFLVSCPGPFVRAQGKVGLELLAVEQIVVLPNLP
jgi:hypothetical protein